MKLLAVVFLWISTACLAAEGKVGAIVLLQPDFEFRAKRVEARSLADYLKSAQAEILTGIKVAALPRSSGFVVIAVRDNGESRIWLDMTPAWSDADSELVVAAVRKVPAFSVANGDVVFALKLSIDGAEETSRPTPMPRAWHIAMKNASQPLHVEQVVGLVWPRAASGRTNTPSGTAMPLAANASSTAGFEWQKLDITEGSVQKPKGWFYAHSTDGKSITWTLSKEDARAGQPYKTGFRIQFIPSAAGVLNSPVEKFVDRFVEQKKSAAQVIRLCPPTTEGDHTRRCLETVEGPFRILYTLIWSEKMDSLVVTTFGTPVAEWEGMRPVADRMSMFTLLGENFWKKFDGRDPKSPMLVTARNEGVLARTGTAAQKKPGRAPASEDARECIEFADDAQLRACAERFR